MFKSHPVFYILQRLCIVLAIPCIVFVILNYFNPMMGFLSSSYSQTILILLGVVGLASSITALVVCDNATRENTRLRWIILNREKDKQDSE